MIPTRFDFPGIYHSASYVQRKAKHHPKAPFKEQNNKCELRRLDSLALGLDDLSPLAALDGPWEVEDGDDKE